jgi:flagellar hook capping protein FlgD
MPPPIRHARRATLLFLACIGLLWPLVARGELLLNEILYDPLGADEGLEFVEIWNPDSTAAPLDGVAVEAGDGARPGTWTVVWRGTAGSVAAPGGPFLVDGGALLDALQNGPDAVRLVRNGVVLDLLGYGDLESASLYEGAPAPDAGSGQSLARIRDGVDTGSNRDDWAVDGEPTPGAPNHPDVRLRISRSGVAVVPEVSWPGESVEVRAWVRNSGRVPIGAGRWMAVAELRDDAADAWAPAASASGGSVLPAESVSVALFFPAPAPGPHAVRLLLRDSSSSAESGATAIADTASAFLRVIAGPLVVNELAFRDAGAGEWIEIWLREPVDDIGAFSIEDAASTPRPIDRGVSPRSMAKGSLLVVAKDPALVRAAFALPESAVVGVIGGWPSLNDTGSAGSPADRVRILELGGAPCDAVPYRAEAIARGGSLERLSPDLPSAAAGTWAESVDPRRGTPGRENSMKAPGAMTAARGPLLVAGARVLRRRAGEAVPVVLRATAAARGRRLTVRVHDLLGRTLRTLVEGQRFVGDGAFLWDGRDDHGAAVPAGLYVIRAEALPEDGEAARASSVPMAVTAERR